jgi:hypothetical protein
MLDGLMWLNMRESRRLGKEGLQASSTDRNLCLIMKRHRNEALL